MASKDSTETEQHPLKDDAPQDDQQPPTPSGGAAPSHDENSQANSRSYSEAVQQGSPNVTNGNNSVVSIPREQGTHKVQV